MEDDEILYLGKVKNKDGRLKVYSKLKGSGLKQWCSIGNFDLKCMHKASNIDLQGPSQYIFTATVIPEDATTQGPF